MSIAGRIAWLVILCTGLLVSEPAGAACSKSGEEFKSPEWARLDRQYREGTDFSGVNNDDEEAVYARAARYGYLLGRQARYIGDSAERDGMFTCFREGMEKNVLLVGAARGVDFDPVYTDRLFQSALLGNLDDAQFARYGIDTKKHYPSIFEADWSGRWDVTFVGPKMPGKRIPLRTDITFSFRQRGDGTWLVEMGSARDMRGPYPARTDGGVISFELPKAQTMHFKFRLSQDSDTSCRGKMTTISVKGGNVTDWIGTGERR
ncbi:MAG: hypothetical protein QF893_10565 [Alphaproteobacteria bacterium]|jgi:hypothetical protein|nr:hypothetical protein [Alphaproteobacteria bacterium]